MTKNGRTQCPECGEPTIAQHRPFCSARCRKIDLNRWFNGGYAIPGEAADSSDIERMTDRGEPNGTTH